MGESRGGDGRKRERRDGWGVGEKAAFNSKRPIHTKGRRMTDTRVKPAQRKEEEGDEKKRLRGRGVFSDRLNLICRK